MTTPVLFPTMQIPIKFWYLSLNLMK